MRGKPCLRFSTLTPNQMCGSPRGEAQPGAEQVAHPLGALGQHLERVPAGRLTITRQTCSM